LKVHMQHEHDEELERYLREFEPRAARALKLPHTTEGRWLWLAAGAAAAVLLAAGMAFWQGLGHEPGAGTTGRIHDVQPGEIRLQTRPSTPVLTQLAIEDQKAFDAVVTSESRAMFPSMQEERSALRVLAKP
jgi:hypothetical protein